MPILRVGTDYSGIETPIMALDQLKVPFRHVFSSDIDPAARSVIQERFQPDILFGDATKRDPRELPKVDLYIAGFPCQLFSVVRGSQFRQYSASTKLKHFFACVRAIQACEPSMFVLENVVGLKHSEGGNILKRIKRHLLGLGDYHLSLLDLDSRDYGSLQRRRRLFFVGVRSDRAPGPLLDVFPTTGRVPPPHSFQKDILEKNAQRRTLSPGRRRFFERCASERPFPIFMGFRNSRSCNFVSDVPPCLLRAQGGLYWSGKGGILTTTREDARLQGIPDSFEFPEHLPDTTRRELIGNAMSVHCLRALLSDLLAHVRWKTTRQ